MAVEDPLHTRASLATDLVSLGLASGDTVMVHAAFSKVGPVLGGPDSMVDAMLDVVGAAGSVLSYQDWELGVDVWDSQGRVEESLRRHVPPYDPATARAARANGVLAATIGTRARSRRSNNPGASVAVIGARAVELTRDHRLDDGYGAGSPFARLVDIGGRVLMVGAPFDTMTLLHHAEALADIPTKRRLRVEYPMLAADGTTQWRWAEEFDTARPVVDGLPEDYFANIVEEFLATGSGARGVVGAAPSVLVDARAITFHATAWLEARYG